MIGLDISSRASSWSNLGQTLRRVCARALRHRKLREGLDPDGQIEKFDEVADAVKRVVSKSGTRTKHVVDGDAAVGGHHQEDHAAGRPAREELELQVESEANQYIPFSLDEVSLDFCVIGPSPTSVGDVEVLIAASRKDRVQDRQGWPRRPA
jgi:type IV pilus assembly protein PilM